LDFFGLASPKISVRACLQKLVFASLIMPDEPWRVGIILGGYESLASRGEPSEVGLEFVGKAAIHLILLGITRNVFLQS
jgi:hypothetical protein